MIYESPEGGYDVEVEKARNREKEDKKKNLT